MSGPYRFTHESAKSPLDRQQGPFSANQPVSYKTNVNRAKTKKWVTAKKNAYDGDDWGEYDEYDEYGVDQEPPPPPPEPASSRYYAQPQRTYTDRSFTEPQQQGAPGKGRRNSFETGEEHRAFSASIPQPGYGQDQYAPPQPDPQDHRDFSPSAMPPPLQTRVSAMPSEVVSPAGGSFPPRKSSIGQSDSPLATSPRSNAGASAEKPLPFIRPADIYRRVEEERERERASMESSRPSMDSLTGRPKDDLQSPTLDSGKSLKPLETVAERKSEYLPDFNVGVPPPSSQQTAPAHGNSAVPPPNDPGFRSFVDQAFTRTDDQRSIPPTPISKHSGTDITRSNTDSTSGISPIMSRVPSSATSALKRSQAAGEGSTPVIAEETHEPATTISGPTVISAHDTTPKAISKPFPDHTRNLSSTSLPRSGLATPTRGDSPARSPVVAPQKNLPEPEAAHLSTGSPDKIDSMQGGLSGPSSAYAAREADIASAVKGASSGAAPGLSAAEKDSQNAFLESHHAQDPLDDALSRSRSESPSKGRVQALASTFGEVSSSRRGSTQSNGSRNSIQSWERSHDNSRAPSPTKGSPTKPRSPVKEFRPHLPGQWESFATTATAVTPSDHGDREPLFGAGPSTQLESKDEVELTPTTAEFPVKEVKHDDTSDPLAALKLAGAAMAASLGATVGLNQASGNKTQQDEQPRGRPHGELYMPRPLQMDRTASSISSGPPTPPAKDTPVNEQPPPPPLKEKDFQSTQGPLPSQQKQRPEFLPQLSTAPSADDEESDRLRKEIVASLSPVRSLEPPTRSQDRLSLQSDGSEGHRMSSVLPAEYDSYWADGGRKPSQDTEREVTPTVRPVTPPVVQPPQLGLLNRFSWEANSPKLLTSDSANKSAPVPEPVKQPLDEKVSAPIVVPVVQNEHEKSAVRTSNSYFGPDHNITINEPIATTESAPIPQSPRSAIDVTSLSSPTREQTRSPGLHVVNSADDPEAVDLPPRLSADLKSPVRASEDGSGPLSEQVKDLPNPAVSTTAYPPDLVAAHATETSVSAPVRPISAASPTSPTGDKPLGAREIATINSTSERILTYDRTRNHWATQDHGLEGWLSSALEANPELLTQSQSIIRPSTGTVRHKHTASLSMLGKFGGSSMNQAQVNEPFSPGASQPPNGGSPTAATQSGSGFDRRIASAQMQMKGKDLLHSAEKLSGKGLTSAKGLFAKGKSRFGREKVPTDSMPSSREASEEPEFPGRAATTTPERSLSRAPTDTDIPKEERKKRRFSITSFRRTSRSRSRPSSIALPSNASFYSSTPKGTPPREFSRILGEEKSRPHSYHAPDSWNFGPGMPTSGPAHQDAATPPRDIVQQARLGILPSPAKSAFSGHEPSRDHDAPPVPPIPDSIRLSNDLSHEVLQSVIRYSTPPLLASKAEAGLQASSLPEAHFGSESAQEHPTYRALSSSNAENEVKSDSPPNSLQHFRLGLSRGNSGANVLKAERSRSESPPHYESRTGLAVSTDDRTPDLGEIVKEYDADDMPPHAALVGKPPSTGQRSITDNIEQQRRRNWETDIIGAGDVSPISSRSRENEDVTPRGERASVTTSSTPWSAQDNLKIPKIRKQAVEALHTDATREYENSSQSGEALSRLQPQAESAQMLAPPNAAGSADGPQMHQPTRRVSASPLQAVHAVEEYAASDSSYTSWDHNSTAARSISGSSQPSDMRDESDLVTPVAGVPTIVQNGQADRAEPSQGNMKAAPNGFFGGHGDVSHSNTHSRQQSSDLTVPERSKSMLSMISSMVSEGGTPISPASSNAGRSTPSTIRRMHHETSIRHPSGPGQIPEDSVVNYDDSTPTGKADDFELYADHDGVVKGVQDERGQPLRVGQPQGSGVEGGTQMTNLTAAPSTTSQQKQNHEDQPRYSTERPMSFISGPPDQDGKPQDQINSQLDERATAPLHNVPNSMVYSSPPPNQISSQLAPRPAGQQVAPSNDAVQAPIVPHGHATSAPAGQRTEELRPQHLPGPAQQEARDVRQTNGLPLAQGPLLSQAPASGTADPMMYGGNPAQYVQQPAQGPGRQLMPDNDPRFQRPNAGQPGPRNEYEFQQQMRQLQSQFPRPQGAGRNPLPPVVSQQPVLVPQKQSEKTSSKPKFSSVFKGLGSKFQSTPQPVSQGPQRLPQSSVPPQNNAPPQLGATHHPNVPTMAPDQNRTGSFQSGVSSLHREQYTARPDGQQYIGRPVQQQSGRPTEQHLGMRPVEQGYGSMPRQQQYISRPSEQQLGHRLDEQQYSGRPGEQQVGSQSEQQQFSGHSIERPMSGRPGEPPSHVHPPQRPPSNGAESHFSGVSHVSSTRVQPPTDSRLDLRKPLSPAPYQGIPPQQHPQGIPVQRLPQPAYPTGGPPGTVPEAGKKKRFSTLGNFFGRSNDGSASKLKPGKQDKNAQKGMRHSTAPVMGPSGPQWPSQQPQQPEQQTFRPPHASGAYGIGQYPQSQVANVHTTAPQFASPQTISPATPQSAQNLPPHVLHQQHQHMQQRMPSGQQIPSAAAEQGSAYMRTKQLADEHQAQRLQHQPMQSNQAHHPANHAPSHSFTQKGQPQPQRQENYGPPSGGYYKPDQTGLGREQPAYKTSQAARQSSAPQLPVASAVVGQAVDATQHRQPLHVGHTQTLQNPDQSLSGQQRVTSDSNYGTSMAQQTPQQSQPTPQTNQQLPSSGIPLNQHLPNQQQHYHQARLYNPPQQARPLQPEQVPAPGMQPPSQSDAHQHVHGGQLQGSVPDDPRYRSASGPMVPNGSAQGASAHPQISQRHVSSPQPEPRYETPQIPAAYSHVSGAFISPRDLEQQPLFAPPQPQAQPQYISQQTVTPQFNRQYSDSQMSAISPQVSAQSEVPHSQRQHSDASTVSVISPVSTTAYDMRDPSPAPQQRAKPRMSSISEVHQSQGERPWHLNFPEGATEQEIVRARQRQYMAQQFTAQQQAHAERAPKSPSPRMSTHTQSPATQAAVLSESQRQSGGFRELLPRSSPQPYASSPAVQQTRPADEAQHVSSSGDLRPVEPAPIYTSQALQSAAAYALPMSPDPLNASAASPINPLAAALAPPPPPQLPHSPMHPDISQASTPMSQRSNPMENKNEDYGPSPPNHDTYAHQPPPQTQNQEQQVPDEAPPSYRSYDGPTVPADGMDKIRPERTRPPNIVTDSQPAQSEGRPRQSSIGLMQHPQPASMAASPQRATAAMGSDHLRRQLLQQEELARMERIQRAQIQQAETERERQEREAARARARELERSVSGGGRVGSLRSVTGSRTGGTPGWERRGSNSRPVFELPAVEDDEPAMRATSYPGQEWQPPVWIDD